MSGVSPVVKSQACTRCVGAGMASDTSPASSKPGGMGGIGGPPAAPPPPALSSTTSAFCQGVGTVLSMVYGKLNVLE